MSGVSTRIAATADVRPVWTTRRRGVLPSGPPWVGVVGAYSDVTASGTAATTEAAPGMVRVFSYSYIANMTGMLLVLSNFIVIYIFYFPLTGPHQLVLNYVSL